MLTAFENKTAFTSNPIINTTSFIEERVLLNKALLDGARDVSTLVQTNNKIERNERMLRYGICWSASFLTPFVTLPLTNRLAMKHIAKLSKNFNDIEHNLIKLSYNSLTDNTLTQQGVEEMSKRYDFSKLLKENDFNYEKIRKKIINAKTSVLSFDFLFTSATLGCAGFINRWRTRKKTGKDGFSAEFNMADKNLIEKRAEKFKKSEKLRNNIFIIALAVLAASPLILRKGLNSSGTFANFIKKHADKFDYNDGIFMKRLPFLLMTIVADLGIIMSSRNQTEVKDNAIRLGATQTAFFGGDIVIGSLLASLSDKIFNTNLLNKNCQKNLINKILPPIKPIKDLAGKDKKIAAGLFWINMLSLFAILGIGVPCIVNKMIKKDVQNDIAKKSHDNSKPLYLTSEIFKKFHLETSNII